MPSETKLVWRIYVQGFSDGDLFVQLQGRNRGSWKRSWTFCGRCIMWVLMQVCVAQWVHTKSFFDAYILLLMLFVCAMIIFICMLFIVGQKLS